MNKIAQSFHDQPLRYESYTPTTAQECGRDKWHAVATHSHHLRGGNSKYPDVQHRVVEWCRAHGVRALGLGSPWEPISARSYGHYEREERDLYYSPDFDHSAVRDEEHVQQCIDELNEMLDGDALVYLDNETPKARFGHLWWFGWSYLYPAWHDYSQDRPVQYYDADPHREINVRTGQPHRRRPYLEVVAEQRAAGAVGIWAHPTSWWLGKEGEFVTNIAAELPLHLLVDGFVDGMVVMGYDSCHRSYQELWFHLLDAGWRIPAFAECDVCFDRGSVLDIDRPLVNQLPLADNVSMERIVQAARTGCVVMSTGDWLHLSVDGCGMGEICETSEGHSHTVRVDWFPRNEQDGGILELLGRGGDVLLRVEDLKPGTWTFSLDGHAEAGYVVARVFGAGEDPEAPQQQIRDFTLTNPVYFRPLGCSDPEPVQTQLTLTINDDSPWKGGAVAFETANGDAIKELALEGNEISIVLPASARLRLTAPNGQEAIRYLVSENQKVQELLAYLHDGLFRDDYDGLPCGDVPPEAFRIDEMREALKRLDLEI